MSTLWKNLSIVAITIGFACLFFSVFIPTSSIIFTISIALGVSLMPTGIISIITSLSSSQIIEKSLRVKLDMTSETLKESIDKLRVTSAYLAKSKTLGVLMVYENRNHALVPFMNHLEYYVKQTDEKDDSKKEIVFVGSSLKGLIEDDPKFGEQLSKILEAGRNCCNFKFLLTHPHFSQLREIQEDRPTGGIAKEILHAIAWLEDRGIPQTNIKLYKGTPTCFMIASKEKMLINPYSYERVAYLSFCLELENLENENSIYYSFWTNHFYKPWYGEEKRKDHFMIPNSLAYIHNTFDGPIPSYENAVGNSDQYCDYFVINDTGSFYIAINVRGLSKNVPYNRKTDGTNDIVTIGNELTIKLLDMSGTEPTWVELGRFDLSEVRNGFWHKTIDDLKSFDTYSMVGIFDEKNYSPFKFKGKLAIKDTTMPILWKSWNGFEIEN